MTYTEVIRHEITEKVQRAIETIVLDDRVSSIAVLVDMYGLKEDGLQLVIWNGDTDDPRITAGLLDGMLPLTRNFLSRLEARQQEARSAQIWSDRREIERLRREKVLLQQEIEGLKKAQAPGTSDHGPDSDQNADGPETVLQH